MGIEYLDKLLHFIEYFIFLLLAFRAFSNPPVSIRGIWAYILASTFSIIFAALDEYHQSFVAGRQSDFYDLVSDVCGIILAAVLIFLVRKRNH